MSRTKRNIPDSRRERWGRNWRYNEAGEFVGDMTPWKDKFGYHQHMDSTRGGSKYRTGHGGINCRCCTKLPADELKVAIRRYERRKDKQKKHDESEE